MEELLYENRGKGILKNIQISNIYPNFIQRVGYILNDIKARY